MQNVADFYHVNIIVFDDIKDKKIFGSISGLGLLQTLDCISWFLGVEWLERKGVYYVGGNAKSILVFDSAGIEKDVEAVFTDGKVKILKDKLIASGTERELNKISDAIKEITNRKFVKIRLRGFEVTSDKNLTLGVDIQKSFEYMFSTVNYLKTIDPITHLSMSVVASLRADCSYMSAETVIDTDVGLLTGEDVEIHIGENLDRQIYSQSTYGEQSNVTSGFNTMTTGLMLKFKAFRQSENWFFKVSIENSVPKSDLKKQTTSLLTTVKVSDFKPVLLCELNTGSGTEKITKGIPFLCDIPFAGYLFRVTDTVNVKRKLYFTLQVIDDGN